MTYRQRPFTLAAARATLRLAENAGALALHAVQRKPGFFNEHVKLEIGHADAVRLYVWLGETLGRETNA